MASTATPAARVAAQSPRQIIGGLASVITGSALPVASLITRWISSAA